MVSALLSRLIILLFGTLYPAYSSYKAVKKKDVREYVKWMMYWIVFAFFTAAETIADVFISWLPLYYEVKILFIVWMLLPATKGSSILFRRFVHPWLSKNEQEIDRYIEHAKENGYVTLMRVGKQGLNMAADTFVRTALTGQNSLVQTIRRYKSLSDLNEDEGQENPDGPPLTQATRSTWYSGMQSEDQFENDLTYRALQDRYNTRAALLSGEICTEEPPAPARGNMTRASSLPCNTSIDSAADDIGFDRSKSPETLSISDSSPEYNKEATRGETEKSPTSTTTRPQQSRTSTSSKVDYGSYRSHTLPRSRTSRPPPPSVEYSPWMLTTKYDEVRHFEIQPIYNPEFRRSFPDTLPYRTAMKNGHRPLFTDEEDGLH